MAAAEEERLRVGADVFYGNNVDSVRLRNTRVSRMTLIIRCTGMALEIVQRSEVPNDAWRNLESHYRAKKTMEPVGDPLKIIMENDLLAQTFTGWVTDP